MAGFVYGSWSEYLSLWVYHYNKPWVFLRYSALHAIYLLDCLYCLSYFVTYNNTLRMDQPLRHSIPQHPDPSHKLEPKCKVDTRGSVILLRQALHCATRQHSRFSVDAVVKWQSSAQCTDLQRHQGKQPWKTYQIHSHELALWKETGNDLSSLGHARVAHISVKTLLLLVTSSCPCNIKTSP